MLSQRGSTNWEKEKARTRDEVFVAQRRVLGRIRLEKEGQQVPPPRKIARALERSATFGQQLLADTGHALLGLLKKVASCNRL